MLARVLAMAPCLSVSVTNRSSIQTAERIGRFFGMGAFFDLSYMCFKKILVTPKIGVLPSGTLLQTLDLENFATAYRLSKLSSRLVDAQGGVINWTVVGQLSWQYIRAPTLDRCSLYITASWAKWSSSSVYITIPSSGWVSDSWYSCRTQPCTVGHPSSKLLSSSCIYQCVALFAAVLQTIGWLGSRVVSVLHSGTEGPGFKSQS